jgi:uncharacterized protein (TIGR02246 family)
MRTGSLIVCPVALLSLVAAAWAQDRQADETDEALKTARQLAEAYTAAFNRGDAAEMVQLYAPNADVHGVAIEKASGRRELRQAYQKVFNEYRGARIRISPDYARFIRPPILVSEGAWTVTPAEGEPMTGNSTIIAVRRGDEWRIVYRRSWRTDPGRTGVPDFQ